MGLRKNEMGKHNEEIYRTLKSEPGGKDKRGQCQSRIENTKDCIRQAYTQPK